MSMFANSFLVQQSIDKIFPLHLCNNGIYFNKKNSHPETNKKF